MKSKTAKYLCLSLITLVRVAPSCCMEHSGYNPLTDTGVEKIAIMYNAVKNIKNPLQENNNLTLEDFNFNEGLCGNRTLNRKINKVIKEGNIDLAKKLIEALQKQMAWNAGKELDWIKDNIKKLKELVSKNNKSNTDDKFQSLNSKDWKNASEAKDWTSYNSSDEVEPSTPTNSSRTSISSYKSESDLDNSNNPDPRDTDNETPLNKKSTDIVGPQKAEIVELPEKRTPNLSEKEQTVDIPLRFATEIENPEAKLTENKSEIKADEQSVVVTAPVKEDLTKSILFVEEVQSQITQMTANLNQLENKQNLSEQDLKNSERASQTQKLIEEVKKKMQEAEAEIQKLKVAKVDNKSEQEIKDLEAKQKEQAQQMSFLQRWFTFSGWFSGKK